MPSVLSSLAEALANSISRMRYFILQVYSHKNNYQIGLINSVIAAYDIVSLFITLHLKEANGIAYIYFIRMIKDFNS